MDKWIMKQEGDDFFMGVLQEGDRLHPRDINGPYVKSEDVNLILAERDRLAAEISATNAAYATLLESHELILDALTESDATLDRLRAVGEDWIRGGESLEGSYEAMTRMYAILNPENET